MAGRIRIDSSNGPDVVIGGRGNDWITAGGDDQEKDVVLGDNGRVTFQGTETFDPGEEYSIISFNLNAGHSGGDRSCRGSRHEGGQLE